MQCNRCNGLTIRGLCWDCAPELHDAFNDGMVRHAALEAEFTRITGKTALENWYEFEAFLDIK